ncbi:hypothetical protein TNCT_183181 [Trichonephila clavata]|uniref:Uncharacterized protein n=1 Tax=Trichonephila clavata TaxID=2740835 RepID=A0A8X6KH56_TRICU|nr:hypothetical protein TNCT_183181 [Trichonephila clavata]
MVVGSCSMFAGKVFDAKSRWSNTFPAYALWKRRQERQKRALVVLGQQRHLVLGLNSDLATRRQNSKAQKVLVAGDEMYR